MTITADTEVAAAFDLTGFTDADRHHAISRISLAAHAMRSAQFIAGGDEKEIRARFHRMSMVCSYISYGPEIPGSELRQLNTEQRAAVDTILTETCRALR